jgi:hypothetical protein
MAHIRVRHGSYKGEARLISGCVEAHFKVRRGSLRGGGLAHIVCGVAHFRFAVRQARVRISARHPKGGPLPSGSHEVNKRVLEDE